jgi:hypothetical protein
MKFYAEIKQPIFEYILGGPIHPRRKAVGDFDRTSGIFVNGSAGNQLEHHY